MDEDWFKTRIDKAFRETEKWAEIASDFDKQIQGTDETSPDFDRLKEEHGLAHSMANSYQAELEGLFEQRERWEQSQEVDPLNVDAEVKFDDAPLEHGTKLRSIADEYLAAIDEREALSQTVDDIEHDDEVISLDHMQRAEDIVRQMEDKHLGPDQDRSEDETIQLLGESHMALYEAGREAQKLTPPVEPPKPEPVLNPEMKIRR